MFFSYSMSQKQYKRINIHSTSHNTISDEIILFNSKNEDSIHRFESKSLNEIQRGYSTKTLSYYSFKQDKSFEIHHDYYDSITDVSYEILIKFYPEEKIDIKEIKIRKDMYGPESVSYSLSANILDYYTKKVKAEFKTDKDPHEISFPPDIEKYFMDTVDFEKYDTHTNCQTSRKIKRCDSKSEDDQRHFFMCQIETDSLLLKDSTEIYKEINLRVRRIVEVNKFTGDTTVFFSDSISCLGNDICQKSFVKGKSELKINNQLYIDYTTDYMRYQHSGPDLGRNLYLVRDEKGILKSGYASMKTAYEITIKEEIKKIDELGRPLIVGIGSAGRDWYNGYYPFELFPSLGGDFFPPNPDKLVIFFFDNGLFEFINYYKQRKVKKYRYEKQKDRYTNLKVISRNKKNKSEIREREVENHGIKETYEIFYR